MSEDTVSGAVRTPAPPDAAAIRAAAQRIAPWVRRTPLLHLSAAELGTSCDVTLKLELLQASGSFKPRGAFNRMLSNPLPAAGVIAASGGNHGAAVAYAARALGVPAEIYVPEITGPAKLARIRAYGATLVQTGASYDEARQASEARAAETGALLVHAYDQEEVLAGQGTLGLELEEQAPALTHILLATGGGGLIGGVAAWYGERAEIVSVEPEACPTLYTALREGRPVPVPVGGLAADSLGARQVGALMFGVARRQIGSALLVPDAAIRAAQQALWERCRLVAEPGGATALAALLSGAFRPPEGARVGVVVCGANTDPGSVA
ncbi:threonine/serine dehydratase [Pseudoroseomonas cervicalis]|uniref:threonine/serine dehydratase n=1 Tax=Teichococcus cervicalis TaxID=204525 RepID=UPI0022F1C73A|nr:threonine/serine dehydratase [Pseudoroseomonas cervicalis]WBV43075.1 threonine/serine dehydratase [Pseudoroseomonas cervicalis]